MYYDLNALIHPAPMFYYEGNGTKRPLTDRERVDRIREMMGHPLYANLRNTSAKMKALLSYKTIIHREIFGEEVVLDDTERLKELRALLTPLLRHFSSEPDFSGG